MNKQVNIILLLLFTGIINAGCFQNFYKAAVVSGTTTTQRTKSIDSLQHINKFFILRSGTSAFAMKDIKPNDDQRALSCKLDSLPADHWLHLSNGHHGKLLYKKKTDQALFSEVHVYIPEDSLLGNGNLSLSIPTIQKIEVIQKNTAKTSSNHVLSVVGIVVGTVVIFGIVLSLMVDSLGPK